MFKQTSIMLTQTITVTPIVGWLVLLLIGRDTVASKSNNSAWRRLAIFVFVRLDNA
jgi:hypothetical protein